MDDTAFVWRHRFKGYSPPPFRCLCRHSQREIMQRPRSPGFIAINIDDNLGAAL
jgi:hypothetical protein